jgi:hypothetical protein
LIGQILSTRCPGGVKEFRAEHKDWIKRCRKEVKELFQQYEEKYKEPEDEEDDEPVVPARLMHMKRRDSDSSSSGQEGFIRHGVTASSVY